MRNVVQLWFKCLAANNVLLMCKINETTLFSILQSLLRKNGKHKIS